MRHIHWTLSFGNINIQSAQVPPFLHVNNAAFRDALKSIRKNFLKRSNMRHVSMIQSKSSLQVTVPEFSHNWYSEMISYLTWSPEITCTQESI